MKRRGFIKISSLYGGGWILFNSLPLYSSAQQNDVPICFQPHPLIKLCDDGNIIIYIRKQEMGQGVNTSLPMLVAEELDADWQKIKSEIAPFDYDKKDDYTTWSSDSIYKNWQPLRIAGAAAREMLVGAAAKKWNIDPKLCQTEKSKVINSLTNETIAYKDIIAAASTLPVPAKPILKNYKDFKIIGKGQKKMNAAEIVTGKTKFAIDFKLPGMLYALVLRCPVHGGKLKSYDAEAAKKMEGVKRIVEIKAMLKAKVEDGVAVVADSFWTAQKALNTIKATWDYGPNSNISSDSYLIKLKSNLENERLHVVDKKGTPEEAFDKSKEKLTLDFEYPFLAHAPLEPANCTANYKEGKFELWGGFQVPGFVADTLPELFEIKREDLTINLMLMGGGFGRRASYDSAAEAMQIVKVLRQPVKVYWTRTDDMQHDAYRPAAYHRISASLDNNNNISSWQDIKSGTAFWKDVFNQEQSDDFTALELFGGGAGDFYYPVLNFKSVFQHEESPVVCGPWRSIGYSYNNFSVESMIDELAYNAKINPLDFRLKLLTQLKSGELKTKIFGSNFAYSPQRLINLLKKVGDEIEWYKPRRQGHFYGIACCAYLNAKSYAAHAFEISIDRKKKITIHKIVAGIDCGMVIDPDGLRSQMEGAVAWALSAALRGEITLKNGMVQQSSLMDYGVLRFDEMPEVKVSIMDGKEDPGSVGEVGVPSVAPALCSAIYAATNYRVKRLPISKEGFTI